MKRTYWFIVAFFLWCLMASQWYILSVKGISTDVSTFNQSTATMAILEILVMLVVAVFIGFAIAWFLQQNTIDQANHFTYALFREDKKRLDEMKARYHQEAQKSKMNRVRAESILKEKNRQLTNEADRLKVVLKDKDETIAMLKNELQTIRPKLQLAEVEIGRHTMQIKQLEMQLSNEKMIADGLKQELENGHLINRNPIEALMEKVPEKNRDDLKMISGIGPAIESKLNAIGIYTFKQISEFTPEDIDYITSSIKFFPNRIGRDNWIGQAAALVRHRK